MKKRALLLLIVFSMVATATAFNTELDVWTVKPIFLDNETVVLNLNITNHDLNWGLNDARVIINTTRKNYAIQLGDIPPDTNLMKNLDLGLFEAGSYRLESYVDYNFIGTRDKTQTNYIMLQVQPSTPIAPTVKTVLIKSIKVSDTITIQKEKFEP